MDMGCPKVQADQYDGGGAGGGTSWGKVFKIAGIGCGVLVLLGGLLVGLGVFRIATCCSDFEDLAKTADATQQMGHDFATALHEGDYDGAYDFVDDQVRDQVSREEFEEEFEQWRPHLEASRPFPLRLDLDIADEDVDLSVFSDINSWKVTTHFAEPASEEVLELRFVASAEEGDDEGVEHSVVAWEATLKHRSLETDPYAQTARRLYDRLRRGDLDNARALVSPEAAMFDGDQKLQDRLEALSEELRRFDRAHIYGLYPEDDPGLIRVRLILDREAGTPSFVDFLVDWREMIAGVTQIEEADVEVGDGDDDARDSEPRDETGETGEDDVRDENEDEGGLDEEEEEESEKT